jgi:hypothetical protein
MALMSWDIEFFNFQQINRICILYCDHFENKNIVLARNFMINSLFHQQITAKFSDFVLFL